MFKNKTISDQDALKIVKTVFELIGKSKSVDDIIKIPQDIIEYGSEIEKNKPNIRRYPRLRLRLSLDDIRALESQKVIDGNYCLKSELATGYLGNKQSMSPLEKLLYSILWKNSDLGKESHILNGIKELKQFDEAKTGKVFYNFGKYISGQLNCIIDQHTIRAYSVFLSDVQNDSKNNNIDISSARKVENLNNKKKLIESYKIQFEEWLSKNNINDDNKSEFCYEIDRLIFSIGKIIKIR